MAFDEARYLREVIEPARLAGGAPPEDLLRRYGLREPLESLAPAEIAETVRQVRQCWRRARQRLQNRKLVDRLEAEHTKFAKLLDDAGRGDLDPLRAELRRSADRARERLAAVRERLADAAGALRMLPPDLVASIARSAGVAPETAASLTAELGIAVREPDRLPDSAPYRAYGKVREALDMLGTRHLAAFLFGADGPPPRLLGAGTAGIKAKVGEVEREWQRRPRGPSTVGADTVLTALRNTPDPAALMLYDIVARLRERVREHSYDDRLLRHATQDLGLDHEEAKRLVFAVLQEKGLASGPAGRLRALIDAGEVQVAADFAESLPESALTGEAGELAGEIRARVAKAEALRERARTADEPDEAWIALEDALRRVPDLTGAADLLAGLAPRPARRPHAIVRDDGVTVMWERSGSRAGEIGYDVLRDGTPLLEGVSPGARDDAPPVNVPVTYAVVARRGQAAASPAAAEPVIVRPEPRDVHVAAGDGVVTGRWTAPRGAVAVRVTRDGRALTVSGSGFRDSTVRNGVPHTYVVAAVYPGPRGEVVTPGIRRTVTAQVRPDPVDGFTVETVPAAPDRLLARCRPPASGQVEFLILDAPPPWPYGTTISVDEARRAGRLVPGSRVGDGYLLTPGRTPGVLLALTVGGDLATVGAHREHAGLITLGRVTAERRGPAVFVGLDWPEEVPEVEVRWAGERRVVTAAAYRSRGGIRIDAPETEELLIEIRPATIAGGSRVTGTATTIRLAGAACVRYDLRPKRSLAGRSLVLRLDSDRPVRLSRLVLVLKPGTIQPRSADDGRPLAEWTDVTTPATFTLAAPRQAKPYWLRCFCDDGVELVDPPIRYLKTG